MFDIVQPESILEASSLIELGGDPSEDNTEVPSTIDETSSVTCASCGGTGKCQAYSQ